MRLSWRDRLVRSILLHRLLLLPDELLPPGTLAPCLGLPEGGVLSCLTCQTWPPIGIVVLATVAYRIPLPEPTRWDVIRFVCSATLCRWENALRRRRGSVLVVPRL